jgi:hypothetical protein
MTSEQFITMGVFVLLFLTAILISLYLKKNKTTKAIVQKVPTEILPAKEQIGESGCDIEFLDEYGTKIIESMEIRQIPTRAHKLNQSDIALHRVKHLTSDLFKGMVSIPNKTVEVVFKPDIQKGLAEGTHTLMKTKSGEVLADAIDCSTKKIAGKGRLIQGGKARQLVGGAFQLVSIAVAQSHLADIERSLETIKDSISEVLERQENEDKANITGAFDYLSEIALFMKEFRCPEELSQQKRNVIESIIRDSYTWRNKLEKDISSLTNQVKNLQDIDTFGTKTTYERIKEIVGKISPLLQRHELLLNLASATNFVTAYIDPKQTEFTRIKADSENWTTLVEEFKYVVIERSSRALAKSIFNSNETLELRNERIKSLTLDYQRVAIEQQKQYEILEDTLEQSIRKLIDKDGGVHLAISFDEWGEIKEAAIV